MYLNRYMYLNSYLFGPDGPAIPYRLIFSCSLTRWIRSISAALVLFPPTAARADRMADRSASAFTEAREPGAFADVSSPPDSARTVPRSRTA